MITTLEIAVLLVIATIGHVMALIWLLAGRNKWKIAERTIYDLPINDKQMRREFWNSLHTPSHAVILFGFLCFGFFQNTSIASFFISAFATLHWIHAEHHKSHLNSPFTAISFSFTEKLIFDLGILGLLAGIDLVYSLNFYGIAAWFIGYLLVNSFSHANFELKSKDYNRWLGKVLTSTTYHSLHHSRYTGNYGLGTRVLDRIFRTEWDDYERLYDRISREERPLTRLREKVEPGLR
jgi:Delta7-sterol 5-desaturase